MATKSILLVVSDPQLLTDIKQALGADWETTAVSNEGEAASLLENCSFDALLTDFNLGSTDASDLLNWAWEKTPKLPRFLLAYEADLALVAAKVLGDSHLLPKPVEPASLKSRIEQALPASNPEQGASAAPGDAPATPTIPPVYAEVLKALESPEVTNDDIGKIIAKDTALSAEVLKLTQSAYRGAPRNLRDPAEAVATLGLDTVKALVMALRFLAEHSHLHPGYLSIRKLWRHSTNVAQIARDLVLFETRDRALASQALAAGLIHDLGKVVLMTNFDDLYGRVHSLARKQPVPLCDIEKEMFGADHGEIGACLVGMWNLPAPIVEAAAFHHDPPLGEQRGLTPLVAVHLANVLESEIRPNEDYRVAPAFNKAFLSELGLLPRLPVWRAFAVKCGSVSQPAGSEPRPTKPVPSEPATAQPAATSSSALQPPPAPAETWTATSSHPDDTSPTESAAAGFWPRRWVYAGSATILFSLALWYRSQLGFDEPLAVHARTPAADEAQALDVAPPTADPLPPVPPAPEVAAAAKTPSGVEPAMETPAPATPPEAASAPPPTPLPTAVAETTSTKLDAPASPTAGPVQPEFRLNGIIYSMNRPSAILNGRMVYVGDLVNGVKVVAIATTAVTLEGNGKLITCTLH